MSIDETMPTTQITLSVTPDEARLIVEGLKMIANSRRFAFKEREEDVDSINRQLFESVGRIEALVKERLSEA